MKWEKRRRRGPVVFVLSYGGIALALLVLMLAAGGFMLGGTLDAIHRNLLPIAAVFVLGGLIVGAATWVVKEREYRKTV